MTEERAPYKGPQRVFSGMQPTGNLHLGNYLGALKRWIEMGKTHECLYCIVDMHAITDAAYAKPAELAQATREVTAAYIAAGLDPKKHIIFNQSKVHEHAELAWIFNCVARVGWMNRMTQFKDKAGKDKEKASLGLYSYPTLMAADILLYKGTHVPVGDDQKQHVELARDIAQKFNNDFGAQAGEPAFFPLPEPMIGGPAARIMSLRDGTKKMSKSDPSDMSRINLTDDPDAIANKIKRAKTDPEALPETLEAAEKRPEADNLLSIYAALADEEKAKTVTRFAGKQFSSFKDELTQLAVEALAPITSEMRRLMADTNHIDRVLTDGASRAQVLARPIMVEVRRLVGFV
jgi:tryptophanyl-tRNA synthetase